MPTQGPAVEIQYHLVTLCRAAGPKARKSAGIGISITGTSASRIVRRTAAARPGSDRCDQASAIMSACSAPATLATCSAAAPLRSSSRAPGSAQ